MIQATKLTKHYGKNTVVNAVSLNVKKGEIFGLLGPNAAGKTTFIRMLCGIIKSDAGEVQINNMSVSQAKKHFGYVAQSFGQYEELTVSENIEFYAKLYGVNNKEKINSLLQRYDLTNYKHHKAGTLSGGYKRRLALACALSHNPKVLFLDEPTAGIDPVTRKLLWDDFYQLSSRGITLFVTTHYMEEAQRCHQLAFMSSGNIVATGTPETIKESIGDVHAYISCAPYKPELHRALSKQEGIILINQFGNELRVIVKPETDITNINRLLTETNNDSCKLQSTEPNLEDVFIALTQSENK